MADLEKLLLEAAGRTSGGRNQQSAPASRRQLHGSYFDEGSDSKDDDDSEDEHKYGGRKASSAQVPLQKRAELSDRENDSTSIDDGDAKGGGGDNSGDSDVGSDLFKNEHDREALFKMCELEREMILSERAVKKADKKLQQRVRTKHSSGKKTQTRRETMPTPLISSYGVRSSVRSADRAEAMDDSLNELRAKRTKQQNSGSRGLSPEKQKELRCSSGSSSSETASESGSESEEGLAEDEGSGESGAEERGETEGGLDVVTFEEVKGVTIRRSRLAKWFMEPFFEKLIVGCFVRVGVGKSKDKALYKICMVRSVDTLGGDKSYKLESWTTSKYLNCVYGKDKSELWQMAMVSDKEPSVEEFDKWLKGAEGSGGPIPAKIETAEKAEAIQKTKNMMIYSPDSAKMSAKMNNSARVRPMNVAAEKERLRREMGVAESRDDTAEVERIKVRMREVEASRRGEHKDSKAVRLAEMNKRNRAENYKTASGLKRAGMGLKAGEEGYDPFSRRWTRSMNYYMSKTEEAAVEEVQTTVVESKGAEATAAALEAAADAGKLVDTSAPVDQGTESNTLHDFPLPISLAALQRLGGPQGGPAGFMARKQRQEAVIGCKLPLSDRSAHPLTLTVSDYKRRRGLL